MTLEEETIFITEHEQGCRLDKILAARYEERFSRNYFQSLIEQQLVLINGLSAKKRDKPVVGDEIEIQFAPSKEMQLKEEEIPLDIIFEDEHLIVVNKPAGMVVHPAVGNWSGTFVNGLIFYCKQLKQINDDVRPGIVHRLDKDTSGILIAAKHLESQQKLIKAFAERQVYKEYLALCLGKPKDGLIDEPIGRHPTDRKKMVVTEKGKPAVSQIKVLSWNEALSLTQVIIKTGRTHQIRVHLKHKGTPVLGDPLYGNSQVNQYYNAKRQLLHARSLRFTHPFTEKEMVFEARIPGDLEKFIEKLSFKQL